MSGWGSGYKDCQAMGCLRECADPVDCYRHIVNQDIKECQKRIAYHREYMIDGSIRRQYPYKEFARFQWLKVCLDYLLIPGGWRLSFPNHRQSWAHIDGPQHCGDRWEKAWLARESFFAELRLEPIRQEAKNLRLLFRRHNGIYFMPKGNKLWRVAVYEPVKNQFSFDVQENTNHWYTTIASVPSLSEAVDIGKGIETKAESDRQYWQSYMKRIKATATGL